MLGFPWPLLKTSSLPWLLLFYFVEFQFQFLVLAKGFTCAYATHQNHPPASLSSTRIDLDFAHPLPAPITVCIVECRLRKFVYFTRIAFRVASVWLDNHPASPSAQDPLDSEKQSDTTRHDDGTSYDRLAKTNWQLNASDSLQISFGVNSSLHFPLPCCI